MNSWEATCIKKDLSFRIEEDPLVGFYLLVYEKESCIKDYLEDTLLLSKSVAYEDFGIPMDSWSRIDSN